MINILEEIYLKILESNIINFILMVSVLVFIFKKNNLGRFIDQLTDETKTEVTTSAEAVQKALDEYKKTRKEARNIPNKKEEIIDRAKLTAGIIKEKALKETAEKESALDKGSEKQKNVYYERQLQKTADDIQTKIYELSKETVQKMLNPEVQIKTINEALDELDGFEVAK